MDNEMKNEYAIGEVIGDNDLNYELESSEMMQFGDRLCRVSVWSIGGEYGTYES